MKAPESKGKLQKVYKVISWPVFSIAVCFPLLSVAAVYACPVCFGGSQSEGLLRGFFWGFMILLGFTFLLLGGIGYAVYKIEKHRGALEKLEGQKP